MTKVNGEDVVKEDIKDTEAEQTVEENAAEDQKVDEKAEAAEEKKEEKEAEPEENGIIITDVHKFTDISFSSGNDGGIKFAAMGQFHDTAFGILIIAEFSLSFFHNFFRQHSRTGTEIVNSHNKLPLGWLKKLNVL